MGEEEIHPMVARSSRAIRLETTRISNTHRKGSGEGGSQPMHMGSPTSLSMARAGILQPVSQLESVSEFPHNESDEMTD